MSGSKENTSLEALEALAAAYFNRSERQLPRGPLDCSPPSCR
jgi:hypothetical protein